MYFSEKRKDLAVRVPNGVMRRLGLLLEDHVEQGET